MKKIVLTIGLIYLTFISFGQVSDPKHYCQDCCGFQNYKLMLNSNKTFEIVGGEKVYGSGTYKLDKNILTLEIKSSLERIELIKIRNSDSLIIHFNIIESIQMDSAIGTEVHLRKQKNHSFIYYKNQGTIKSTFDNFELIKFQFVGYEDLRHRITSPGEYQMKVTLIPHMKIDIKAGDKKVLKLIKRGQVEKFKDLSDKKIKFTTKKCPVIITRANTVFMPAWGFVSL